MRRTTLRFQTLGRNPLRESVSVLSKCRIPSATSSRGSSTTGTCWAYPRMAHTYGRRRLPSLRAEAQRRLEDCTAELNTLPQNVEGEPLTEVLQLLAQFCVEVGRWVEGVPNAIMLQKNREAFQWFDRAIRSTAPLFVPCKRSAKDKEGWLDWLRESGDYEGTRLNEVSLIYLEDIREHIQR